MERNDKHAAWKRFERTGGVGAYLLYRAIERRERDAEGPFGER